MNINKLFNEYLDITTKTNKTYHIECKNILIHDNPKTMCGKLNVLIDNNDIVIFNKVYSFEDNRIRYSYTRYKDVKSYPTIEKLDNGDEEPIYVVESFKKKETYIGSIGNIKNITSDKINDINNKEKSFIFKRNKKQDIIQDLLEA